MVRTWVRRVAWTVVSLLVLGAIVAGIGAMGRGGSGAKSSSGSVADRGSAATGVDGGTAKGEAASAAPTAAPASGAPNAATAVPATPADAGSLGGLATPTALGAKIVKTATITIEVGRDRWDAAVDRIVSTVGGVGGYVQSSSRSEGRASYQLEVPVDAFERAVGELRSVGKVTGTSVSGVDVTDEYTDLEARLRHWQAQEALFMDLMSRARTIQESISVQQQLSATQLQIEQLEGKRRLLETRTSYSTISLEMGEPGVPVSGGGGPAKPVLAEAWTRAVGASLAVLAGSIVVLGVAVPLAVLALPVLAVWFWIRRREDRNDAAPAPAASGA